MLWLLNYFWLSLNPVQCASWYCDQHCFKIGSEVIESIWDAVLELFPEIEDEAKEEGFPDSFRKRRHAKSGNQFHPLSVWHGLCKSNIARGLENAEAIFKEHHRRTNKWHMAYKDLLFLRGCLPKMDFNRKSWSSFFKTQTSDRVAVKGSTGPRWSDIHAVVDSKSIKVLDRNTCPMTSPPKCVGDFPYKVTSDVVDVYRAYYITKIDTIKGGMHYYHTVPPRWLSISPNGKDIKSRCSYKLDEEGYVVIVFSK